MNGPNHKICLKLGITGITELRITVTVHLIIELKITVTVHLIIELQWNYIASALNFPSFVVRAFRRALHVRSLLRYAP
jgi:hypothetical protein